MAGAVSKAECVKNKVFLSFSVQEPPDFMIVVAARQLRPLKKRGMDPLLLVGKTVRVREWVTAADAPSITITDPH